MSSGDKSAGGGVEPPPPKGENKASVYVNELFLTYLLTSISVAEDESIVI